MRKRVFRIYRQGESEPLGEYDESSLDSGLISARNSFPYAILLVMEVVELLKEYHIPITTTTLL